MRIKFVVLSALLGGLALLGCWALLPGVPSSGAQNPVKSPDNRERGGWPQLPATSTPSSVPRSGGTDERFLRLDRNGDGLLNVDEMTETLKEERNKWDVNGDRHIDLAEWNEYLDAVVSQPQRSAANAGSRAPNAVHEPKIQEPNLQPRIPSAAPPPFNNAQLPKSAARPAFNDNSPRKPPANPPGRYPKNLPAWFKDYDVDGDGQVGLYEWQAKKDILPDFKKYDLNDDGFITVEELVRSGQFITNTNAPPTVNGLQAEIGDVFFLELTGSNRGVVWGTDVYTADSLLAAAAVHAGVLEVGAKGHVKVTILPGQERYEGSVRNGMTSQGFGVFPKSFRIEAAR